MKGCSLLAFAAALSAPVFGQQSAWAQCGGKGWSGGTTCVSGYVCTVNNEWYSQCVPGTQDPAPTITKGAGASSTKGPGTSTTKGPGAPTTKSPGATTTKGPGATTTKGPGATTTKGGGGGTPAPSGTVPWWFGVNLSGAEFGEKNFNGVYGKDFTWYDKAAIDTLLSKGMNMFRINFLMERITPNSLTGSLDRYYAGNLTDTINYITGKGAYAMIQPHNYGRFYGNIITDVKGFQTWWATVAKPYVNNKLVVFDINNEFHDMDQQLVFDLNQAGINGIRAAGATSQYITPEGNSWTGAWTWVSSGNAASLINLKDPYDSTGRKLIYQMHQYLDSDGSGTSANCVSSTIFKERLVAATNWLKQNKKLGLIGEYAGGANEQCIQALQGGLQYLKENKDVWTGNLWWAAGPWWGNYMYNLEPPSGLAYTDVLPSLMSYAK